MNSVLPEGQTQNLCAPSSGAQVLIGYQIDLNGGDGKARVVLDLEDKHRNRNGSLHGGIIAMMLDASAGFAASMAVAGDDLVPVVTISLNTSYLAPALDGQVIATGMVQGGGRSICYANSELRDTQGTLLATGTGVFKYMYRSST